MKYVATTWLMKPETLGGCWLPGEEIDHEFTKKQIELLLKKELIAPVDEQQGDDNGKISTELE